MLFSSILLIAVSCQSYLDVDDKSNVKESEVVSNFSYFSGVWAYLYDGLQNGFAQVSNTMLASACDEADNNQPFNAIQRFNEGSWNGVNNPDNASWARLYGFINQANLLKELSDTTKNEALRFEIFNIPGDDRYDKYRTEWYAYQIDAEFFNAYYHFELWRRFGKIPLVDHVLTEDEAHQMRQSSTDEIIDYIAGKLNTIIPMYDTLAKKPATMYTEVANGGGEWNSMNTGRVTKGAALALKVRAYLFAASPLNNNGVYNQVYCDSAAVAAAQLINLNQYSIEGTNYRDLFLSDNNKENILDARVALYYRPDGQATSAGRSNYFEKWNYPKVDGNNVLYENKDVCNNAVCPSQNLADAYMTATGYVSEEGFFTGVAPFDKIVDKRFFQTFIYPNSLFNGKLVNTAKGAASERGAINSTTTGYFLKKFVHENLNINTNVQVRHVWYVFRYGEVLLNYAESVLHGTPGFDNGLNWTAEQAVNLLHARLDRSDGSRVLPVEKDYTVLTDDLLRKERQVELAFEGHRFFDVRRWLIAEETENTALVGVDYNPDMENPFSRVEVEKRAFISPKMYWYPIPNDDLINYPGWDNNGWI